MPVLRARPGGPRSAWALCARGSFLECRFWSCGQWELGPSWRMWHQRDRVGMGEGSVVQQGEAGPGRWSSLCRGEGGEGHAPAQPFSPPVLSSPQPQGQGHTWLHARLVPEQRAVASVRGQWGCEGPQMGGLPSCRAAGAGSLEAMRPALRLAATQGQSRVPASLVGTSWH